MSDQVYVKNEFESDQVVTNVNITRNTFSIVIPAYNEEKRIENTISDIELNIPEVSEIIVVCDGSDRTEEVALSAGKKVKVLSFEDRLGHGGAVLRGIQLAKSEVVCFIDADGSAPWFEVKRLCDLVSDENPAVIASRWATGSVVRRREPFRNTVGGRIFHFLALFILGIQEKDVFCGLKAFKRSVAIELSRKITISDRMFNPAIIFHLNRMGIKALEIGIEWSYVSGTKLKVGFKVIIMMFLTLIGIRIANNVRHEKLKNFSKNLRNRINFL